MECALGGGCRGGHVDDSVQHGLRNGRALALLDQPGFRVGECGEGDCKAVTDQLQIQGPSKALLSERDSAINCRSV